jgi:hypothetical protein
LPLPAQTKIVPLSDSLNRPPAVKKKAESSGTSASGSGTSAASGRSGGSGSAGGGQGKSDVLLKMEGGPSGASANPSGSPLPELVVAAGGGSSSAGGVGMKKKGVKKAWAW